MKGRMEGALAYFHKAEKLYKRIGDKVSYAYTRWSMGMARKGEGDLWGALAHFDAADALFKSTGDLRGRSYAALGRAELLWMAGKDGEAERKKAEQYAKTGGYAWELLHAKVMRGGAAAPWAKRLYAAFGSRFFPKGCRSTGREKLNTSYRQDAKFARKAIVKKRTTPRRSERGEHGEPLRERKMPALSERNESKRVRAVSLGFRMLKVTEFFYKRDF
jgi:tetratricopeptide (TPR) repeat protein